MPVRGHERRSGARSDNPSEANKEAARSSAVAAAQQEARSPHVSAAFDGPGYVPNEAEAAREAVAAAKEASAPSPETVEHARRLHAGGMSARDAADRAARAEPYGSDEWWAESCEIEATLVGPSDAQRVADVWARDGATAGLKLACDVGSDGGSIETLVGDALALMRDEREDSPSPTEAGSTVFGEPFKTLAQAARGDTHAAGFAEALSIVEEYDPSEFLADHRLTPEVAEALDEVLNDLAEKLRDSQIG